MSYPLSQKQLEFVIHANKRWNLAHGPVRSGKTSGVTFRFMEACDKCPDSKLYIVGHTFDTAYRNVVRLIMEGRELEPFRPFCTWSGKKLLFKDKVITVLGAKDEGAIGNFQGLTMSVVICDEMTLYPDSIIDMIDTRLSQSHSIGFATMNPSHPDHKIKKWIDKADEGDPNYYQLQLTLDDNPFVPEDYKRRIRDSLSGVFYKRNYLGLWCMAEGSIFDFFDRDIHVKRKAPRAAEYYIAAIDYGQIHPFVCLVVGVSTGKYDQSGKCLWVEDEYFWDSRAQGRQKTNGEFARDLKEFLEPYGIRNIYMDPSAEAFQVELRKMGMHVTHANNDVDNGIQYMTSEMCKGNIFILEKCKNTIRQIERYVWDNKASEKGDNVPVKKEDDACDALRYAVYTHKVQEYKPYKDDEDNDYMNTRFQPTRRR